MSEPRIVPPDVAQRETLCLSTAQAGMVVHGGDLTFKDEILRLYSASESNAAENLVKLKDVLRRSNAESFWPLLTQGLANIADAQYVNLGYQLHALLQSHHVMLLMWCLIHSARVMQSVPTLSIQE